MANTTIQLKKSATPSATPSVLANGEIAINYADGKIFYKNATGSIVEFSPNHNAFASVNANGTLIVADSPTDIVTIAPGTNITIVGDAVNDVLTIGANLEPAFNYANSVGGGNKAFVFYQNAAPATSNAHDFWINSDTGVVYENFGTNTSPVWAEFGPSSTVGNLTPGIVYTSNLSFGDGSYQTTAAFGNAYSSSIGANAYSTSVGAASNTYSNAVGTGSNNYASSVGAAANATANTQHAAGNNWANTIGTSSNGYATTIGASANNWANTKLANTTGTFSGSLTVTGNTTVNGIAPNYAPNRPAFRVYGSGTTNNLGTTQNGTGCLTSNNWTVSYNQGTYLSNTNGVFTAPVTGLYQVCVIGRNSGYSSGISQIGVTKNGTSGGTVGGECILMIEFAASSTMNHAGGSTIINLNAGDTLACKILAGQINFDGNDNWSVAYIG